MPVYWVECKAAYNLPSDLIHSLSGKSLYIKLYILYCCARIMKLIECLVRLTYVVCYHTEQQNLHWNVTQIIQCLLLRWYYQTSKGMDCSKQQKQLNWFVCSLQVSGYCSISWFWCCVCLCNALVMPTSLSWLWVEYVCMLYIHNLFNMQPDISLIPTHTPPGSLPLWVCIPWYVDAQLPLNVWHI